MARWPCASCVRGTLAGAAGGAVSVTGPARAVEPGQPGPSAGAPPPPAPGGSPWAGRPARRPLDPPLVLNGGFGEFRSNHFHAGLDLGTGGRVGRVVHAPLAGWIERVRASGVGYGR